VEEGVVEEGVVEEGVVEDVALVFFISLSKYTPMIIVRINNHIKIVI
jgi:hypothetical protein